jgi:hypothetical protein
MDNEEDEEEEEQEVRRENRKKMRCRALDSAPCPRPSPCAVMACNHTSVLLVES